MKRILTITAVLFMAASAVGLTACSARSASVTESKMAYADTAAAADYEEAAYEMAYAAAPGEAAGLNGDGGITVSNPSRKLIKDVTLEIESKDYDSFTRSVTEKIKASGGYVENSSSSNPSVNADARYRSSRNMNITARIPADRLDDFVAGVCAESNLTFKSERVTDITLQYTDTASRKKSLIEEQNRLNELMKKAETVEDLITIEQRLSEVRYQLESIESQLRTYDNQVDYSTVYLNISEVVDYTPQKEATFGEKIAEGFSGCVHGLGRFFEGLIIFILAYSPLLATLAIIAILIIVLVKKLNRNKPDKGPKKAPEKMPEKAPEKAPENAGK